MVETNRSPAIRLDETAWEQKRGEHCVEDETPPYKRTWGLPILSVQISSRRYKYNHPRGAIGIVVYRNETPS